MRMKLPHVFVPARWARRITGHQGFTYLFWTFVDLRRDEIDIPSHDGFIRHEQRHVQQSVLVTVIALGVLAGAVGLLSRSPWWLLASLFAWPLAYWAVSVVWKIRTGRGYTDNYWERDARRYEERTR